MYSLESPQCGNSNEDTQHTFVLEKLKEIYLLSWPGAMINTHKLELPLSRTSFYGSKGVRAIEVRL